jgi:hypothetical protein
MPKRPLQSNLREYAIIGAAQRIAELEAEVARIRDAFPELQRVGGRPTRGRRRGIHHAAAGDGEVGSRKRRRTMSAAARKRISEAQKARWARLKARAKT